MGKPYIGVSSQLPFTDFLISILQANELLTHGKKRSDEDLLALLAKEFPTSSSVLSMLARQAGVSGMTHKAYSLNSFRQKYNRGELTRTLPTFLSFRYSSDGYPVEERRGNRYLTPEEIDEKMLRFRKFISVNRQAIRKREIKARSKEKSRDLTNPNRKRRHRKLPRNVRRRKQCPINQTTEAS